MADTAAVDPPDAGAAEPRSPVPAAIGSFDLDAVLARGTETTLYRATDRRLGRLVALRVAARPAGADALGPDAGIPEPARAEPVGPGLFAEAAALSAVDHPHVLPLYEVGEADGHPFSAARFVDGPDLATLAGGRPIPVTRALALVRGVAEALDAVHARGLVHLDVKAANVLVGPGDHVYLAGFALARRLRPASDVGPDDGDPADEPDTATGGFVGAPAYAAPEHLRGGRVDHRTDVYSLTCLLVAALTGRPPYTGGIGEVVAAHQQGRVPTTGLGAALDAVVERGMAVDPDRRYGSARDLVDAAREAAAGTPARSGGGWGIPAARRPPSGPVSVAGPGSGAAVRPISRPSRADPPGAGSSGRQGAAAEGVRRAVRTARTVLLTVLVLAALLVLLGLVLLLG